VATEARTCASRSRTPRSAPSRRQPSRLTIPEAIERLPVGAGNEVTERRLRPIARLPHDEQLTAVAERLDLVVHKDCG
jgi:hypothetical protein